MWLNVTLAFVIGFLFGGSIFAYGLKKELQRLAALIEPDDYEGEGLGEAIDQG